MTIAESLHTISKYPIPSSTIEKICIERGLVIDTTYSKTISESQDYQLATADVLFWLSGQPNLTELESSVATVSSIKENLLNEANRIYGLYDDPKFSGRVYGFKGENFND